MRKAKKDSIVHISSIAGLRGFKGILAYSASKFAVTGMTKFATMEFRFKIEYWSERLLTPLLLCKS